MASFTDTNPQQYAFNPYIQELPLDAYVKVGLERQRQFDMGVAKVQSYIDSTLNLPIAKAETQEYVKGKLSQLKQHLSTSVTGDFSDGRLINQIGGLTSRIANDPIVQNGVQSTLRYQSGLKEIEQAKKEGKYSPENEAFFNSQVSQWLSDGRADTVFEGSYIPYTDIIGRFTKMYNDGLKSSQNVTEDAFRIGKDGQVEINPALKEGISAERVEAVANLLFSQPDVQAQLQVSGWYRYRGATPEQIFQNITETSQENMEALTKAIRTHQFDLATKYKGEDDNLSSEIERLKKQQEGIAKRHEDYRQLLQENPEAAKAALVKEQITSNLIRAYTTEKLVKNPLWDADLELKKFHLQEEQFKLDQDKFTFDKEIQTYKATTDRMKAAAEEKKSKGVDISVNARNVGEEQGQAGSGTMYQLKGTAAQEFSTEFRTSYNELARLNGFIEPYKELNGRLVPNVGPGGYKNKNAVDQAVMEIMAQAKNNMADGTAKERLRTAMDRVDKAWDKYAAIDNTITTIEQDFKPRMDEIRKQIGNEDMVNAYIVLKKLPNWESARQTLKTKYGQDWESSLGIVGSYFGKEKSSYKKGAREDEYKKIEAQLNKSPELVGYVSQREEAFRNAQQTFVNKEIGFSPKEEKDVRALNSQFSNILGPLVAGKQENRGDYKDLQDWTAESDKGWKDNNYYAYKDENTGKYFIGIRRGSESREVEVPYESYINLPNVQVNNEFQQTFGDRLSLTGGKTTEVEGKKGRQGGYHANLPDNFPYSVQFHLVQGRDPNTYNIRLWVADRQHPENVLVNGEPFTPPGISSAMDLGMVMEAVKSLNNPTDVLGYLKYAYPNKIKE